MSEKTPELLMREAIELSRRGWPAPNPHVGSVIVRDGEVVGRGAHLFAGSDHAEVAALKDAGTLAKGATAYITMEPCNHRGRTGPCSMALIEAGIAKVVFAVPDPNPKAVGGAEALRAAGVGVESGLLEREAAASNEVYLTAMRLKRPYVCLKAAMSLDGRSALPSGQSKWITGEPARREGRLLRAEMGAVLVGVNTVLKDDPSLTARDPDVVNEPVRIVLDPNARLTGSEAIFKQPGETWVVDRDGEISTGLPKTQPGTGGPSSPLDLAKLLSDLFDRGLTGVLVEGGAVTSGFFLRAGLCDRLELFVAPRVFGDGSSWVNGLSLADIDAAPAFEIRAIQPIGEDFRITASPLRRNS